MDAKLERVWSLGRRECGRVRGSLLVLLHGTTSTREDFARLEGENERLQDENERLREEAKKKRRGKARTI